MIDKEGTYLINDQLLDSADPGAGEIVTMFIDSKKIGNISRFIQHAPHLSDSECQEIFGEQANNIATANMEKTICLISNSDSGELLNIGMTLEITRDIKSGEMLFYSYVGSDKNSFVKEYIYFQRTINNYPTIFNKNGEPNPIATEQYRDYLDRKVREYLHKFINKLLTDLLLMEDDIAPVLDELIDNSKKLLVKHNGNENVIVAWLMTDFFTGFVEQKTKDKQKDKVASSQQSKPKPF